MIRWVKNNLIIILTLLGTLLAIGGFFVVKYSFFSSTNTVQDKSEIKITEEGDDLFPEVDITKFYDELRFKYHDYDWEIQITDDLIALFIKEVVSRFTRNDGVLTSKVRIYSRQDVRIDFFWEADDGTTAYKGYGLLVHS